MRAAAQRGGRAGRRAPRVEVRRVRDGLELRVDGTLASAVRTGRSLTGPVWWALAAPVLLLDRPRPRCLLLGLAAGSVARAIRELRQDAEIVGVEIDRQVLAAARRHFALGRLGVEVVVDDARLYLRRERRLFDLVVEDLFVGPSRSVRKPDWLLEEGYPRIGRRLRQGGLLVSNTIHEMPAVVRACRRLGGSVVYLDVEDHWNRVVVCGELPPPQRIRTLLGRAPALAPALRGLAVRRA